MRKGADCLSKWVGEAERQLRLLFEQARTYQPSIIFFDEIDGLTPVRSAKQDQIHSSIVSTLLALMDGLDSRGQVVVIGATNRVDALDPALRRPGRFDRELYFSLPNKTARREILDIHLQSWQPPVAASIKDTLSEITPGYAGADLKALCTEAALCSLHRSYPQIYQSTKKLKIDSTHIQVTISDFLQAFHKITPSAKRSGPQHANPVPTYLRCLLSSQEGIILSGLYPIFPFFAGESGCPNLFLSRSTADPEQPPLCYRPRLVLTGSSESAIEMIAKSLLYRLDSCYHISLDVLSLSRDGSMTDTMLSGIREAFVHSPSILYIPRIDIFSQNASEIIPLLTMALNTLPSTAPVLVLATSVSKDFGPFASLFSPSTNTCHVTLSPPSEESIRSFILQLLPSLVAAPSVQAPPPVLEELEEVIEPPKKPVLTQEEIQLILEKEEHSLRELRNFFREVLYSLSRNSRYRCFVEAVKKEDVPDYYDIIEHPMCFDDMFVKLDKKEYVTLDLFMKDLLLIQSNAKEYNPNTPSGRRIIRAASSMIDEVESTVYRFRRKLGYDLFKKCDCINERRMKQQQEEEEKEEVKEKEVEKEEVVKEKDQSSSSEPPQIVQEEVVTPAESNPSIDENILAEGRGVLQRIVIRRMTRNYDGLIRLYTELRQLIALMDSIHMSPEQKIAVGV